MIDMLLFRQRRNWLAAIVATGLATAAHPALADVDVVTTTKPLQSLVAGVLGSVAKPGVLVTGNASPHTFSLKPSDAMALAKADLFVRVSEEVEPFTRKMIASLPKSVTVMTVTSLPGMKLLPIRSSDGFEAHSHGEGHDHGHSHGRKSKSAKAEMDGHVWLDPANAKLIVRSVADTLAAMRPQHAATFRTNADAVISRLDALDAELKAKLMPVAGRPFVVFHDAYQYLEARYGLTAIGSITVNPEVQPSGKRLAELRRKISTLKAVCVASEPQFQSKLVAAVTEGTPARTGVLDPLGGSLPAGSDHYFQMMRNLATALAECTRT